MSAIGALPSNVKEEAKSYLSAKEIPQLFESLTAGLLHHKPEDPVQFVQECLCELRARNCMHNVRWDTFIEWQPPTCRSGSSAGNAAQ